jgi:flavin-dependent dehydrogenase
LVSFSRFFTLDERCAPETLIESFAQGWWYTARTGGRRVVTCLTDADIALKLGLSDKEKWLGLLSATRQIKESVGGGVLAEENITRTANSARLTPVGGSNWLAVGDAASAFDPLSSQGITKSLRSGVFASYTIADLLVKSAKTATRRYEKFIETEFAVYQKLYKKHYSNERRWRESAFWQRRQN